MLSLPSIFVLVGVVVIAVMLFGMKQYLKPGIGKGGYHKKTFLTPNEVHFYQVIYQAVGDKFHVMAQVSMGAVIDNRGVGETYWKYRRQYNQKMIDYVLCDKKTLEPILIIELDDKTHSAEKDHVRDSLTRGVGYKTLRIQSTKKPKADELRDLILKAV